MVLGSSYVSYTNIYKDMMSIIIRDNDPLRGAENYLTVNNIHNINFLWIFLKFHGNEKYS